MKEDRISQLPDEILHHILSFIDTSEAVQTSILSKRWKHLWRSFINIRLNLHRVPRFISRFLSQRDTAAPLHDFHLSLNTDTPFVEECLLYAINHGVQSLRLHGPNYLTLRLPTALSTSTTLRELEIRQKHKWINVPARFSLPNLKTLYLDVNLSFKHDDWGEPFAGLPELLELNLPMLEEVHLDIYGTKYQKLEWFHLILFKFLHQLGNATIVTLTLYTLKVLELDGGPIEQSHPPFPNLKCLKVIRGSSESSTVLESVMNYLTIGTLYFESSLKVEIPHDVAVVQKHPYA